MATYTRIYGSTTDTGVDGTSNATYLTARATTTATTSAGTATNLGQHFTGTLYINSQAFLVFDTSAIGATVGRQGVLSINAQSAANIASTDSIEVRRTAAVTNKISGANLSAAAQTPYYGVFANPLVTGRIDVPLNLTGMARTATCYMLLHSQRERLGTAPTISDRWIVTLADQTGTTTDPYLDVDTDAVLWQFVGVSAVVEVTAAAITLTEPAGVADGDLLVACFASRTTATTAVTNTGWTAVNSQNNNNTTASTSGIASGTMLYQVRAGTPDLTFVVPAGISVMRGQIVAYRGGATTTPLDVSTAGTTAAVTLACSWTGLTTTQDDDLIVAMVAGGQEAAWSAFNATTPSTASGTTDIATAPSPTTWIERADSLTTAGADTSLAIFDAVKTAAGATGNLTATASVAGGNVVVAGAFKIFPAVTAKTLPADAGTYALTGTAATPSLARLLDATTTGSYALTGVDATLTKGVAVIAYNLPADAGSYALTGATAGLYRGREVAADPGSYALTGATASLERGREVAADPGSYALSGAVSSLELGREVEALPASYALTGSVATLSHAWKAGAVSGSYNLAGSDATLTKGAAIVHRTLPADAGSYALSGAVVSLELGREVSALSASYALSGAVASLERGREVEALPASYALTGAVASFRRTWRTAADAGSYGLSGQAATFRRTWKAAGVGGTYALTGLPVNLLKPGAYAVIGLPGAYALSGAVASLEWNRIFAAAAGTYALSGSTASLIHAVARTVVATAGSYALTGAPAALTYSGAAYPPVYRSISSTSYASRALETVCDVPSGTVDGDILIAAVFAGRSGDSVADAVDIEITPPVGWTQIGSDTEVFAGGFIGTLQVYWKRAAGEPASYSFAHTGATTTYSTQGLIAAYSGCAATGNPVVAYSQNAASSGATATGTNIYVEATLTKLIYVGHNWDATGALTAPTGTTERFDDLAYLSDEDTIGDGSTGARTQALASDNPWAAFLVALKSVASVAVRGMDALPGSYALTGAEDVILEKSTAGILTAKRGLYSIVGEPAVVGHGLLTQGGVYEIVGATAVLEIGVEAVEPPVLPIVGGGGTIPKKQLRRAVRELLKREEKRKGRRRPKVLAREILEVVEAKGLGVREKRIAIRLIGEALRLELPSLFYSQPLIHDKERIARAILFLVQQTVQRLLDEEEDEEAALLLLSAA